MGLEPRGSPAEVLSWGWFDFPGDFWQYPDIVLSELFTLEQSGIYKSFDDSKRVPMYLTPSFSY